MIFYPLLQHGFTSNFLYESKCMSAAIFIMLSPKNKKNSKTLKKNFLTIIRIKDNIQVYYIVWRSLFIIMKLLKIIKLIILSRSLINILKLNIKNFIIYFI
jgi:hypothetical protein